MRGPDERTRHRASLALGAAVAAGLATRAAFSSPFTTAADVLTAIGIGLVTLEVALRWRPAATDGPARVAAADGGRRWPWLALVLVVVAWELVCLFLGPRVEHPTISSLYDAATRWDAVRGACFFGWLVLGSALVRS